MALRKVYLAACFASMVGHATQAQEIASDTSRALRKVLIEQGIDPGSVIAVRRTPRYIIVDTHINPSAGTIAVLSPEYRLITSLPGWSVRILPGDVILYHGNAVHFAPTHSLELWTWDASARRRARLYPSAPRDSLRRAYVDTVRAIYDRAGEAWFRAHNHHMDAERFDSQLGDTVVVGQSGRSIAFPVAFGGGDGTPAATPHLEVIVVCRDVASRRARCSEHARTDLERQYPGLSTAGVLDTLVGKTLE